MTINEIINGLEQFDNYITCCYEECPIYRANLKPCDDGMEMCERFSEAKNLLHQFKFM